ncbi:MAG: ATP-binding cassette domain-containing protein [Candidatus Rokuibacteriota bacterium]|jgi:osmoprotectant transport system ATP-binding protein|nr:ATP-binding cassette domain-containing protein [Patescibacteria group bacterium]
MITVRRVSKRYGGVVALDDVSLDVAHGTTHVLLGPSGSGKSTLLRIVLGVVVADTGEASIDDVPITPATRRRLVGRVGYVVQEGGLFPHLSVQDNIGLPAETAGWSEPRTSTRVRELAGLVGFDDALLRRYPAELSGGQRQRVGLARALVLDPPVLLLDEPLGALDPIVRADLQSELRRIFSTLGKTVVLVTHDVREAAVLGSTITLLRAGRIVQQGSLDDLARRPAEPFVTEFLGAQAPPPHLKAYF